MDIEWARGKGSGWCGAVDLNATIDMRAAAIREDIATALSSNSHGLRVLYSNPVGHAHMLGVFLLELESVMARGKGQGKPEAGSGMPRFVDVKLSQAQREQFRSSVWGTDELVSWLATMAGLGYRIGVSWASEQQAYFVSVTGRSTGGPNDGFCMTSFAGDVPTAVALAAFKHTVVCEGDWHIGASDTDSSFG
jgi:hypothetical protein